MSAPNTPWYNRTYTYDDLNRLNHAEGPYGSIDYTYDGVGNRLTKVAGGQTETYTYITGTNKLSEISGTDTILYTHDANGNITNIGNKILTYNQNNRLIMVEEDGSTLGVYTYNGLGQRVIKTANGITTIFHYDFNGNIIGESDQDGNFTKEYLYRGKGRSAMVDVTSGEIYYFGNDRLGTPQILTDSTNAVVWEGYYKPFGEAEVNPNSSVVNNFRFLGQYFDEETGFHYNYHRYYEPRAGRYLTPDPIGLDGELNLFVYDQNNPSNWFDLFGLKRGELIYFSRKPGSDFPYHVGFDQGNNNILMLTGGEVSTVDLNKYLKKSGYGIVGYADISDYIDPCEFEKNISDAKKDLEKNFCNWDPSGTMCVDVMSAGFGNTYSTLQKNIRRDYRLNMNYPTNITNQYFFRRNTTYVQFFRNTGRFR